MSRHYINERVDSIEYTVDLKSYFKHTIPTKKSIFLKDNFFLKYYLFFLLQITKIFEYIVKKEVLVQNQEGDLLAIDPVIKHQLTRLISQGLVQSWNIDLIDNYQQYICHVRIKPTDLVLSSGKTLTLEGAVGNGIGHTINAAFQPALGELFERVASRYPTSNKIIYASYNALRKKGAINPHEFIPYSKKQLADARFKKKFVQYDGHDTSIAWVHGQSFLGEKCLVPAQCNYIFYHSVHPETPFFSEVSTNGVAAYTDSYTGKYRAICELIERDGYLLHWLRKISPPKIRLSSIPDILIRKYVSHLAAQNFDVYIFDTSSDIQIPCFHTLVIQKSGDTVIRMSLAGGADVCPFTALRKSLEEVCGFIQFPAFTIPKNTNVVASIDSMRDRFSYWSNQKNYTEVDFFMKGETRSFVEKTLPMSGKQKFRVVQNIFRTKNITVYFVDLSTSITKNEGVLVYRALCPTLIPLYFNEIHKPLALPRLYSELYLHDTWYPAQTSEELNASPHLFL